MDGLRCGGQEANFRQYHRSQAPPFPKYHQPVSCAEAGKVAPAAFGDWSGCRQRRRGRDALTVPTQFFRNLRWSRARDAVSRPGETRRQITGAPASGELLPLPIPSFVLAQDAIDCKRPPKHATLAGPRNAVPSTPFTTSTGPGQQLSRTASCQPANSNSYSNFNAARMPIVLGFGPTSMFFGPVPTPTG